MPGLSRSRGEGVAREEGAEPPAVTPDLFREYEEADVGAAILSYRAMLEGVMD